MSDPVLHNPKTKPAPSRLPKSIPNDKNGDAAPSSSVKGAKLARPNPILPANTISGTALTLVVAMMTFLACLTFGGVVLVVNTATTWQNQISREATIQIRPADDIDVDDALLQAQILAEQFDGVISAEIMNEAALARLLEPWLGSGLDLNALPIPRLVTLTIDINNPPDFALMRTAVEDNIPNASLDDHRTWVDRLIAMARATAFGGIAIFGLVMATTVLTVVFATRGAMAGADDIVEVLHFIGAESRYIATRFQRRFLVIGMKGAGLGGILAILIFLGAALWGRAAQLSPEVEQTAALFGRFTFGFGGYLGIIIVALSVALLTAATSHITVVKQLDRLLERQTG